MRIERLTLAPYGRFADRTLELKPGAPLHVVLGPNEAGKSTALSAIADLLYGFPARTEYGFRFDQTALRVGGAFRFVDGSLFEARRRKGRGNTLVDAEDKPTADAPLLAALAGVDRRAFETEFGLNAEALRTGGRALLAAGGALAETLAAGSANLSALVKLRDQLSAEAEGLFTPRRSAGKAFYIALDAYETAERKLREAVVTADALQAADKNRLAAKAKEIELNAAFHEASQVLARLERAERTHRMLAKLSALASEAEGFGDLPEVDAGSLKSWSAALEADQISRAELQRLANDAAMEAAEIEALVIDEALLAKGPVIDGLNKTLSAVEKASQDLPRRVEARAQAIAQLDDIARRLGLADHFELLAAPPSDAELARAREAIASRQRAEEKLAEARGRAEAAAKARDLSLDHAASEAPADPEPLRRKLEPLGERLADAKLLRSDRAQIDLLARTLDDETARLDPPVADLEFLARTPLPDGAALARAVRDEAERAEARRAAEKRLAEVLREKQAALALVAKREAEAAGATRADWLSARERRERGLDRLGEALDGEAALRQDAFLDVRALTLAADAIGDNVVADSARATRLQTAREDLVVREGAVANAEAEIARLAAAGEAAEADWLARWAPSGVAPKSREIMARWMERVQQLLARRAELAQRRVEAEALAARFEEARAALAQWFEALGLKAPPSFELALREAREELSARQKAWQASRDAAIERANAERAAREAEAEAARRAADLAEVVKAWPEAMAGLRLGGAASLVEAEAALTAWGAVALPRQNSARELRSIEGIERDLAEFNEGVGEIVSAVAPDLADLKPEEALARLTTRLGEARRAAAERGRLQKSAAQRAPRQRAEEAKRQASAAVLAAASKRLGAEDETALALALERCEARRALEIERGKLRQQLLEVADGLTEAALREEQAELNPAELAGEIELTRRQRAEWLQAIPEAARAARDAQAEYDTLAKGRDAAGAARERMEARGDLMDIAERWLLRQSAARLAARAIERHRKAAQDPLVKRAGELFHIASGGSFAGLATDYDDADRPMLSAQREAGERVKVDGLSEGARDQLFLSLRLALLERRAGEPLPFVGDDILASFDDKRTQLTLALLAEFGRTRQAILFTHHGHVAELAREAGADVVEL
jgi:uncharacterized protein YhaN